LAASWPVPAGPCPGDTGPGCLGLGAACRVSVIYPSRALAYSGGEHGRASSAGAVPTGAGPVLPFPVTGRHGQGRVCPMQ